MGEGLGRDGLGKLIRGACLGAAFLALSLNLPSCKGADERSAAPSPEAGVAVRAVEAAVEGRHLEFLELVDPDFLETVSRETGMARGPELGRALSIRFADKYLPPGVLELRRIEADFVADGARGTAFLWGEMVLEGGNVLELSREEALRIPVLKRGEGWFVDMLRG